MILDKTEIAIYVWRLVDSLTKGFTEYLRAPTRVAVLYAMDSVGPVVVYDPQSLLAVNHQQLKNYLDSIRDEWQSEAIDFRGGKNIAGPQIDGLLCFAFHGRRVPLQVWIAELSDSDLHSEVIRNWLSQAVLSWELEDGVELAFETSAQSMLRNGARPAVENAIRSHALAETGSSLTLRLDWILDLLVGLSRSYEEKKKHSGWIAFQAQPQSLSISLAKPVPLKEWKHIGKLLVLTEPHFWLIANDQYVFGYVREHPKRDLLATMHGGICGLYVGEKGFGKIDRGYFQATDFLPDFLRLVPEFEQSPNLFYTVSQIILGARKGSHGASVLVDLETETMSLGGNVLAEPLSRFDSDSLLDSMAKVDGAVHVNANGSVIAFGCILDGSRNTELEKPSRGSRFNSAVRFSHEHSSCVIIVVSEDGPVSLVRDGKDLLEKPSMPELDKIDVNPPEFEQWLRDLV